MYTSRVGRWVSPSISSSAASVAAGVGGGARAESRSCSSPPQSSRSRGSVAVLSAPQFPLSTSSARNVTERNPASPDTLLLGTVMHTSPLLLREKNGDAPRITPGAGFYFILFILFFIFFCLLLLLLLLQWTGRLASPEGCPPSRLPACPPARPLVCVRSSWTRIHRVHDLKSPCMDTPWPRSCAGYSS